MVWKTAMPPIANFAVLHHPPIAAHTSAVHHSAKWLSQSTSSGRVSENKLECFLLDAEPAGNSNTKTGMLQNCTHSAATDKLNWDGTQLCSQCRYPEVRHSSFLPIPEQQKELHLHMLWPGSDKAMAQYQQWWKEMFLSVVSGLDARGVKLQEPGKPQPSALLDLSWTALWVIYSLKHLDEKEWTKFHRIIES